MRTKGPSQSNETPSGRAPLQGWKDIATYLDRDARTARRWEQSSGLPVRRHGGDRGSVYAYPAELDAWRASREPKTAGQALSPTWRRMIPAAAGSLALVAVAAVVLWGPIMQPPRPLAEAANAGDEVTLRRIWAGSEVDGMGAVSRDGRYLSFTQWATGNLGLRDLVAGETRLLTNKSVWAESEDYAGPSVLSPDGQRVAYTWFNEGSALNELRVIGLNGINGGEHPETLYSNPEVPFMAPLAWFPDGRRILVRFVGKDRTAQIVVFDTDDRTVKILRTVNWRWPGKTVLSPAGRYILYDSPVGNGQDAPHDIFLLAADGSSEIPLVAHSADDRVLGWTPDGASVLFASDRGGRRGAWLLPVADGKAQGEPTILKPDLDAGTPLGFSTDGSFYYHRSTPMMDVYTVPIDFKQGKPVGEPERVAERFVGANRAPAWSPDGKYLAYNSLRALPASGTPTFVIRSVETGEERDLAVDLQYFPRPRWAPDGRSLILPSRGQRTGPAIFRLAVDNGKLTMLVPRQEDTVYLSPQLTPDGKTLLYTAQDSRERHATIRARNLENGEERQIYQNEATWPRFELSPAADRVAIIEQDRKTQSMVLRLLPVEGGTPREILRLQFPEFMGNLPVWTADGKCVLVWKAVSNRGAELWSVPVDGSPPQGLGVRSKNHTAVSLHPDGHQLAYTAGGGYGEIWVMENFLPETKAAK